MTDKENPEFSVVISAYNKGDYTAQAIESVLSQTVDDFEIIFIDDGSSDNTKEIVFSFSEPRIRYFYQRNSGLPAICRNRGMSLSTGKYISFLDGDDFWHKNKLEKCKQVLEKMPEIDLVCHNEAIMYKDRALRYTSYGPYEGNMYSKLLFKGNCLHTSAVVIRRGIFFEHAFSFSEEKGLFTVEDYEYWLRLSARFKFYFMPEVLGYYRVTETGIFLRNTETNTLNLLSLLDAHFSGLTPKDKDLTLRIRKRRASVMCAAGRCFQHTNNFKESKKWYLKAIREFPFNYKAIIGYLTALLRLRIIYK